MAGINVSLLYLLFYPKEGGPRSSIKECEEVCTGVVSETKSVGYSVGMTTSISSVCSVNGEVATRVLQSQLNPLWLT